MAADDGGVDGDDGGAVVVVEDMDMPCSPRNKMKFLCSHGGNILPRPFDGHLKYIGGETRVVAVPRDITFSELKERLSDLSEGEMVLKYQLIPEDLDTLVSVKSEEDLKHMVHEYNRHENQGSPKLRAFLFPAKPTVGHENQAAFVEPPPPHSLEQRYIDAINGVVWAARRPKSTPIFSISSACSSPMSNSPEFHPIESAAPDTFPPCCIGTSSISTAMNMHRVQSSPSLYRPNSPQSHCIQQHRYPLHHQQQQHHHHHHHQSSKPVLDHQKPPVNERLSMGRPEFRRGLTGHGLDHCYTSFRPHNVSGGFDDFPNFHGAIHRLERAESLPRSPRKKLWE